MKLSLNVYYELDIKLFPDKKFINLNFNIK